MKSFLVSLSLLFIFIILTSLNCIKVTGILTDVQDSLDTLPESRNNVLPENVQKKTAELFNNWQQDKKFLSLTVNASELRDCSTALGDLVEFSKSDTGADYNAALSEAKIRVAMLIERERFSFSGIF